MPMTKFELQTPSVRALSDFQPFFSILDVGCGFGNWGWLVRQYFELWYQRYHKEEWLIKIDAIEIHEPFIKPTHKYLYDNIYIGDAVEIMPTLGLYDIIIIGDVIEHIEKERGRYLLQEAYNHCLKGIILSTPKGYQKQGLYNHLKHSEHISGWEEIDFAPYSYRIDYICDIMLVRIFK